MKLQLAGFAISASFNYGKIWQNILGLHDVDHHVPPHQVGQVELVNVQCPMQSSLLSQSQKPCCLTFLYNFLQVKKNLELHDLVHHLPHQVAQVELVNINGKDSKQLESS